MIKKWVAPLLVLLCSQAQAQTTLYGVKGDARQFNVSALKYTIGEEDTIEFENNRMAIYHADGTSEKPRYSRADYYTINSPFPTLYRPNYLKSNDFESTSSRFCWERSMESEHFIVMWEAGFGTDPTKAESRYRFDPKKMLEEAELIYKVNTEELGFLAPGSVKTAQQYKIMMFVSYSTTWAAYGSGQDDKVGTLDVNPDAANSASTVAHEIGHTFQYIIGCELGSTNHGWRYGFGSGASGGCAWWESCAQWQAYKVYPEQQFRDGWSSYIYSDFHLNLLHEEWRYGNYFIHDYWCQLHGQDFIGRLWQEAQKPEDPVETYKRMTGESQDDFCRDMFNYACRAITWDIDALRETGKNYTDNFKTGLHHSTVADGWWEVDSTNCPQNYGSNVIRLRVPSAGTEVKANFVGETNMPGFRSIKPEKAGWRYGFVAWKNNGERVYGDMYSEQEGTANFTVPDDCKSLWFVVTGAPTEHWRHPWNDDAKDDEQWPYRVEFVNTNLPGEYFFPEDYVRRDTTITLDVQLNSSPNTTASYNASLNMDAICEAFGISLSKLTALYAPRQTDADSLCVYGIDADGSLADKRMSAYAYYYGYNAEGQLCDNAADALYYVMWSPNYNQMVYAGELKLNALEADKTYAGGFAIRYLHTDGKTYIATVKLNIHK